MFDFLFSLNFFSDFGLFVLRLAIAAIFIVHGVKKWAMWKMQPSPQMPAGMLSVMKILAIAEPFGGLALLAGFLTQLAALGFSIIMLGAIYYKTRVWKTPFAAQDKMGWEFDLVLLAGNLLLLIAGAGVLSLDRVFLGL
ncbi:DoxX family protein [Patescibacteria group bacterium]|nr:MAG: DoxX family protein [Patescibacteria group bacterium]